MIYFLLLLMRIRHPELAEARSHAEGEVEGSDYLRLRDLSGMSW